MKIKILFTIVTANVLLCGAWLYKLSNGTAVEFQKLFDGFGVTPLEITTWLFASIDYWWAIMLLIILISYLPLYVLKGKWQYLSIVTASFSLISLVGIVYANIFTMGKVVGG